MEILVRQVNPDRGVKMDLQEELEHQEVLVALVYKVLLDNQDL